jgi:hypothetical protein
MYIFSGVLNVYDDADEWVITSARWSTRFVVQHVDENRDWYAVLLEARI